MACVWKLTKETINLPLGCLQGGERTSKSTAASQSWYVREAVTEEKLSATMATYALGCGLWVLGFGLWGLGFGILGLGFGV